MIWNISNGDSILLTILFENDCILFSKVLKFISVMERNFFIDSVSNFSKLATGIRDPYSPILDALSTHHK